MENWRERERRGGSVGDVRAGQGCQSAAGEGVEEEVDKAKQKKDGRAD